MSFISKGKTVTNKTIKTEDADASIDLLELGRQRAQNSGVLFAGLLYPSEAWALFQEDKAVLIDVRTAEERKFVGRVPGTPHVAWKHGPDMAQNTRFVQEVEAIAPRHAVILLLCRSGVRSVAAARALTQAGFTNAFNVLEGFEGELDSYQQRGKCNGWRCAGLPWMQD
jgi:rhodanese-related sulfurtransferase